MNEICIAIANILTAINFFVIVTVGISTHYWISMWWAAPIWLGSQLFTHAAAHMTLSTQHRE